MRKYNKISAYNEIVRRYKKQAKQRNLVWELSNEEANILFQKPCFYCGTQPNNIQSSPNMRHKELYSGIDRVNPKHGYNLKNTVACCKTCNRAKSNKTLSEFSEWILKISEHYFRQ